VQKVRKTYKLSDYENAFRDAIKNTSEGKILFDLNEWLSTRYIWFQSENSSI